MIDFQNVSKRYRSAWGGGTDALRELTLHVRTGETFAVVGPNGAGKSTLLGLILGYLKPTRGRVRVGGRCARLYVRTCGIGFLPEQTGLPAHLTVREVLIRLGTLDGLQGLERERCVCRALERLELTESSRKRTGELSKGNRQRLGIAQLLLRPRSLIVMDEPASGLDPLWRVNLRQLLGELRAEDPARTLVISSHDLHEIEQVADRVAVIDHGRVRELIDVRARAVAPIYRLRVGGTARPEEFFPGAVWVGGAFQLPAPDLPEFNRSMAAFLAAGGIVKSMMPVRCTLERAVREVLERRERGDPE